MADKPQPPMVDLLDLQPSPDHRVVFQGQRDGRDQIVCSCGHLLQDHWGLLSVAELFAGHISKDKDQP